jgi:hypothetical protein
MSRNCRLLNWKYGRLFNHTAEPRRTNTAMIGMNDRKSRSFAALLATLTGWAIAEDLRAVDVSFSDRHVVNSAYGRFHAIHAADVDGDGDVDILGATT